MEPESIIPGSRRPVYRDRLCRIRSTLGTASRKIDQLNYMLKGKIRLGGNDFASVLPFASEGSLSFKNLVNKKEHTSNP
jgi:hypothetical protein